MPPPTRPLPWLEPAVFGLAAVGWLLLAPGGPGWGAASGNAVLAVQLDRAASAPLYGALADVAAWLPVGEPGFRLAVLDALLAALLLATVAWTARALVPKLPLAGAIGALLLALAPPLRDASGPGLLAGCGALLAVGAALRAPGRDARMALAALGGGALALGSEPWLGLGLLAALAVGLARAGARRTVLALGLAAIGAATIALWLGAVGALPGFAPSLAATLAASGRGAGAIVVGAGLLGAAFAAVTGLPGARPLLGAIALAGTHAVVVASPARGTPLLGLLAVGTALIPVAIVRAAAPGAVGARALAWTAAAGLPLVLVALVAGPAPFARAEREDGAARAAEALVDALPAGPGIVITTREPSWSALAYARVVAGARPDLGVAPPLAPERADTAVVTALRGGRIAGGDVAAVGRLDPDLARPRGRGYQMLLAAPTGARELAPPPPSYGPGLGEIEARAEAIERARYEASSGHLDQAARAAGLAERFGAADLALLASTQLTRERPALYDFVPALEHPPGAWQLDLFGDDLAWVGGLALKDLPADAPAPRRLHALWRAVIGKTIAPDDARIRALGPDAVRATEAMLRALAAGAGSGRGSDSN